jgi:hypothetical protein
MRTLLPTPRVLALLAAVLVGWSVIPSPSADARTPPGHPSPSADKKKGKKGKDGKNGGKRGKDGKNGKRNKNKNKNDGVGPFKKKDYPTSERLRPLVLPNGMGEVGLGLGVNGVGGATAVGLGADFAYGIGDVAELGASTGLILSPDFAWNQTLTLNGHYLALDTKEFDIAPGVILPLGLYEGAPFGLVIDLPSRYVLSDGLFLRFGQGAVPITLSPDFALAISANGGLGYQIDNKTVLFADTSVFTLALAPDTAVTGLWDVLVLSLGGQYSPTKDWDVGATLGLSNAWGVENSFGYGLNLYGRYRF